MLKRLTNTIPALALAAMSGSGLMASEMSDADMKVWRESVDERLKSLRNDVADFNKIRFDGFVNLRYDDTRTPASGTGLSGIYIRRAEGKFTGLIVPGVVYSLGYDFPANKLKDVGLEFSEVPVIPFVDSGLAARVRLGQFRIPFGIMPQTSSSATFLPERPLIFSGGNAVVGERVMGLQGRTTRKLGFINLEAHAGGFNNATQDATAGQTSIGGQYSAQATDNDLSWVFRTVIAWEFLKAFLPEKSSLSTGASFVRDSRNTVWMASMPNQQFFDEVQGGDVKLALGSQILLQGEFARILKNIGASGVQSEREGWYADLIVDLLPWIASDIAKGDKLELILHLEDVTTFPLAGAMRSSRVGGGVKWSYWGGKNHTSVNYLVDGPNQNFGESPTGPPVTRFIIQQQYAFDNGKARFMEKEGD
jgi:hypothetical protein